jgi:glycosyltransferase involved in cell wall biosynthesis
MPNVVLEAMAAGTPVVATPVPALVEVAGGAALLAEDAELAEALRRVVDDAPLRAGLIAAGKVRAASYTWDRAAESLWQAYRDMV